MDLHPSAGLAAAALPARLPRRAGRGSATRHSGAAEFAGAGIGALRIGLIGFIVISISYVHAYVGPLAKMRPGILLWALVMGALLLAPRTARWSNLKDFRLPRLVGGLAVLTVCSGIFGLSPGGAAQFFLDVYGRELLTFVAMVVAIRHIQDLRMLVMTYVVSVGIVVVLSFTVMNTAANMSGLQRLDISASAYDANDLGVLFMIGMALSLLIVASSKGIPKLIGIFVLLGSPAAVALTGSRGALLGMVALGVTLFVIVPQISFVRKTAYTVGAIVALTLAAPAGYWEQMETMLNPTEDYNYTSEAGRKAVAMRGVGYALQNPLFGVGLASFGRAEATLSPLLRLTAPGDRIYIMAPHNTFVQVAAELGLPALLLWCYLLFGTSVKLRYLSRSMPDSWATGSQDERFLYYATVYIPVAFIGFAATSFFVSHAYLPSFYYLIAFSGATMLFTRERLAAAQTQAPPAAAPGRRGRGGAAAPLRGSQRGPVHPPALLPHRAAR